MLRLDASTSVLVLGLGDSGLAMARWCARAGAPCRVVDTRPAPPGLDALRASAPSVTFTPVERFDAALLDASPQLVLRSPGLAPLRWRELRQACDERGIAVAGELELFLAALEQLRAQQGYAPRIVAITGTNGKTTVTRLVEHLARRAGLAAVAAGNIGPPMLDALMQALDRAATEAAHALPQLWALELSSFQLHAVEGFEPDAAALLNITQDHLDWHADMADYAAAKARVFGRKTLRVVCRDDALTLQAADSRSADTGTPTVSYGSDAPVQPGDWGLVDDGGLPWLALLPAEAERKGKARRGASAAASSVDAAVPARPRLLMPQAALPLAGRHNALNVCAALALLSAVGLPLAPLLQGLRSFQGEPHRLERIASTDGGVDWYDDSKGTNVGATVAALEGLARRVVLIAGGVGKGQDFAPLAVPVARHARAVLLIGADAPALQAALSDCGVPVERCASLNEAVQRAATLAQAGDAVLLSPACASTDMFANYAHRGQLFRQAVAELPQSARAEAHAEAAP